MRPDHTLFHFTVIYAFIPDTLSWLHVADLPETIRSPIIPTSDVLVVVDEWSDVVYKASVQGIYTHVFIAFLHRVSRSVNFSVTFVHCVVLQSSTSSVA